MGKKSFWPIANGFWSGAAAATLAVLANTSCRSESGERSADSAAGSVAADVGQPVPGRYTVQDFARLRWLDGSWRGRLPDGGYFYERYRLLNDSTIAMRGFADSLFARVTDSSSITFRGGAVASEGGTRWVATRLDSSAVDFAAERNAANNFTWTRESADRWTATLRSTDRDGRPRTIVYPMERVRR